VRWNGCGDRGKAWERSHRHLPRIKRHQFL
jgi:hypothetical protein